MTTEIQPDMLTAFNEWMNTTAVKQLAVAQSGGDEMMYEVQLRTIAGMIGAITGEHPSELAEAAQARARTIFSTGQDWRRELLLYSNFNSRFWHKRHKRGI